jgi:hypothetical protein
MNSKITSSLLFKTTIILLLVGYTSVSFAKKGMWMPPNLGLKESDLKKMGLKIPVSKLYNDNQTGINQAVVIFDKGCTGEVISSNGLILTNHHCGYSAVQKISSATKDYFANGFWAKNQQEEIPCPGLTVTFVRKMVNVTDLILYEIYPAMKNEERDSIVDARIRGLEKGYRFATHLDAQIKPFFNGNEYWVTVSETYTDVRLVGFPQNGIGAFGGDTDNWMWPRHTGDFSLFRVYANSANKPATYAKNNRAYKTTNFLTINAKGIKEGDFTMVYGFPGTTQNYISSYQLAQIQNIIDPIRIQARTLRLEAMTKNMNADRAVFLKYTAKRASIANGWKKWQGELKGLQQNRVLDKKREQETRFMTWLNLHLMDSSVSGKASEILQSMDATCNAANSSIKTEEYIKEAVLSIELIQQGQLLEKIRKAISNLKGLALKDSLASLKASYLTFEKDFDPATDAQVFNALMPLYFKNCTGKIANEFTNQYQQYRADFGRWSNGIYSRSLLANKNELVAYLESDKPSLETITNDPALKLYNSIMDYRTKKINPILNTYNQSMRYWNRLYTYNTLLMGDRSDFAPDANFTQRLTYGVVKGIDPESEAEYSFQTFLDEAILKDNPNVEEFKVPEKLKTLQAKKDFGKWGENKRMPIAFIASNHTSGGNSGSPVLNAYGELIGTNFDRVWEGTMSDLYYDANICRNITLDVRYTLFIIEKMGNASWLFKEMKIKK